MVESPPFFAAARAASSGLVRIPCFADYASDQPVRLTPPASAPRAFGFGTRFSQDRGWDESVLLVDQATLAAGRVPMRLARALLHGYAVPYVFAFVLSRMYDTYCRVYLASPEPRDMHRQASANIHGSRPCLGTAAGTRCLPVQILRFDRP